MITESDMVHMSATKFMKSSCSSGGMKLKLMYCGENKGIGMYVCVYVCMYVSKYVCVCMCVYIFVHACFHLCTYTCMNASAGGMKFRLMYCRKKHAHWERMHLSKHARTQALQQ